MFKTCHCGTVFNTSDPNEQWCAECINDGVKLSDLRASKSTPKTSTDTDWVCKRCGSSDNRASDKSLYCSSCILPRTPKSTFDKVCQCGESFTTHYSQQKYCNKCQETKKNFSAKKHAQPSNIAKGREYGSEKQWNLVDRVEAILGVKYRGTTYGELTSFIDLYKTSLDEAGLNYGTTRQWEFVALISQTIGVEYTGKTYEDLQKFISKYSRYLSSHSWSEPSREQLIRIKEVHRVLDIPFEGTTFKEAKEYLKKLMPEYYSRINDMPSFVEPEILSKYQGYTLIDSKIDNRTKMGFWLISKSGSKQKSSVKLIFAQYRPRAVHSVMCSEVFDKVVSTQELDDLSQLFTALTEKLVAIGR